MTFANVHWNFFTQIASSAQTSGTVYNIQLPGKPSDALIEVKFSMNVLSLSL